MANTNWGFDMRNIDRTVRPQDDFFHFANGGWIKRAKIPAEESRWGSFTKLRFDTERQLKTLVEELLKKKSHPQGSDAQLVADAYRAAADMKQRNKLGIEPLAPLRRQIYAIESKDDLLDTLADLRRRGIALLFNSFVDQDSKKSTRYILTLWQGGLSLPDRDYYLLDKPEQKRVRDAFVLHIARVLKLAKFSPTQIAHSKEVVLRVETLLAKHSMSKEDTHEPEKTYHKLTLGGLEKLAPTIPWRRYLQTIGVDSKEYIVGQPEFFKQLSKMIDSVPLEDWKTYLEWQVINSGVGTLSDAFLKVNFEFYGKVLTGQKKMRASWRRALGSTSGLVGESLGKLYVKKHFPESAKRAMDALVHDLFAAFEERLHELAWMTPATKKKAFVKLRKMQRKIGYPKKWEGYRGLVISPIDHFGNVLRSREFEHKRALKKLKGPVNRGEWFMDPHTVNAYFSPNLNEIVFPAAILQPPFFDLSADMALNYGAIGAVIGHEITHGFDNHGSKFDGDGNMREWWTKKDRTQFEKRAEVLVKQANGQEVEPGVFINGKLTLGENIADLGGLVVAYRAYQRYLDKRGRKTLGGFTPEQRFFIGFAQFEQEISRPEFKKLAALTDPHAESFWRINCPVSNFEPFYQAFGVKEGDKLYRKPKDRVEIW